MLHIRHKLERVKMFGLDTCLVGNTRVLDVKYLRCKIRILSASGISSYVLIKLRSSVYGNRITA